MKRFALLLLASITTMVVGAQSFDNYFTDNTLRCDYTFVGNAEEVNIAFNEFIRSEDWAGRRVNLASVPVKGNGEICLTDALSGTVLYRNTFSSLFQEWIVTDEAKSSTKSFEATFLVPMPKNDCIVTLSLFNNEGAKVAELKQSLKVDDKLIRHSNAKPAPHTSMLQSGSDEECIDVAIVAEGYTVDEMDIFLQDARLTCDEIMRYEPFASMKERFNFVAVMLPSADSGVSVPQDDVWRDTALGSHFMTFYSPRYLTTNRIHTLHDKLAGVAYEHIIILANTDTYGGGGIYNSYTLTTAHNPMFKPVVVHEFGHSFGALADEYFYEHADHTEGTYKLGYEPWEQNITSMVDFQSKWADMVAEGVEIPTKPTAERRANYTIGAYEGGGYMTKGMYRPADICRMRDNEATQFCAVCQRAIERIIRFNTEEAGK